ncbi:MAG TPA: methyltransferase domain-containing protein [Patescibacteria group bacterium]|nr:methyltransferase domain-containing protein [Patescibacteria group bacterium]
MNKMPIDSIRGRIRWWIERFSSELGDNVLEVGSRLHNPDCWWINNHDLATGNWTGIDMQEGHGVDVVADTHSLPVDWSNKFTGILCSEVLEHVKRPWIAIPEMFRVLQPGGTIIITTLFCFHVHGYPDDYYRYTDSGLKTLLSDAGFVDINTKYGGNEVLHLKNHDDTIFLKNAPHQIFAVAKKPDRNFCNDKI